MNTLYIMCGVAGCGKTTWAHKYLNNIYYISRDDIRFPLLEEGDEYFSKEDIVFENFVIDIVKHLEIEDVVADATHLTRGSRKKLINAIDNYITNYKIIYIVVSTSKARCLKQNCLRGGRTLVPQEIIDSMFKSFRFPVKEEDPRIVSIWIINT